MGVSTEIYVMYAARLDADKYWELGEEVCEELEGKFTEEVGKLSILVDGMSGEYVMFGMILAKGSDSRYDTGELPMTKIDKPNKGDRKSIINALVNDIGMDEVEVSLYAFTHYS